MPDEPRTEAGLKASKKLLGTSCTTRLQASRTKIQVLSV